MSQISQTTCACVESVTIPVTGMSLDLAAEAFDAAVGDRPTRDEVAAMIQAALDNLPTGGGVDYSLEEQWTGKHWIDGKKIYQKTINIGQLPNKSTKNVPHNIVNCERILGFETFATSGQTIHLPNASPYAANQSITFTASPDQLRVVTQYDHSVYSWCYATIFYTCTDR